MDERKALAARISELEAVLSRAEARDAAAAFSWRHLAKAVGTARSALTLMDDGRWIDACILARAVFEQLFAYLWVEQDPARAAARREMVTIKQEWANAKYLEGLAARGHAEALRAEAAAYRARAEALLAKLAAELGESEKKIRDEATLRVSAKALEVNLDPGFTVPYAYYSGFVHTDGAALAGYPDLDPRGVRPDVPLEADLLRALDRLAREVEARVVS